MIREKMFRLHCHKSSSSSANKSGELINFVFSDIQALQVLFMLGSFTQLSRPGASTVGISKPFGTITFSSTVGILKPFGTNTFPFTAEAEIPAEAGTLTDSEILANHIDNLIRPGCWFVPV